MRCFPSTLNFNDYHFFARRSRMNCVIERRRAEELVDNAPKMTPFGFNFNNEPKKRVTGERMAIFCESGNAIK